MQQYSTRSGHRRGGSQNSYCSRFPFWRQQGAGSTLSTRYFPLWRQKKKTRSTWKCRREGRREGGREGGRGGGREEGAENSVAHPAGEHYYHPNNSVFPIIQPDTISCNVLISCPKFMVQGRSVPPSTRLAHAPSYNGLGGEGLHLRHRKTPNTRYSRTGLPMHPHPFGSKRNERSSAGAGVTSGNR